MPELPEVETVRRTLFPHVVEKTVASVDVFYPKMILPETPASFAQKLHGQKLNNLSRHGKYLLFEFEQLVLLVHLRMEGKFYIKPAQATKDTHEHVAFRFTDGTSLRYVDVRKFGTMNLRAHATLYHELPLSKLGHEPHNPALTENYLKLKLKTSRTIKTALLDQTIILGLGNIYVDEVLFCAKINPNKRANTLTKNQRANLIDCSRRIIDHAIALGGSSIRTYLNSLGISGKFQHELNVHLRKDEPCPCCETPIRKIKVGGRGTYYCPDCQKR